MTCKGPAGPHAGTVARNEFHIVNFAQDFLISSLARWGNKGEERVLCGAYRDLASFSSTWRQYSQGSVAGVRRLPGWHIRGGRSDLIHVRCHWKRT
jgi:hypothetical protein